MKTETFQKQPFRLTNTLWLERGRTHEIMGRAAESLVLSVASSLSGSIVWIGRDKDVNSLSPSALTAFVDPTRIVLIEGSTRKDILWAAEQALRSKGAPIVIVHLSLGPNLTESRRLQLASEQGGGLGFILISKRAQSSAAQTRWQCEPFAANYNRISGLSKMPQWRWTLLKNRSGKLGDWLVIWEGMKKEGGHGTSSHVHLVAATAA